MDSTQRGLRAGDLEKDTYERLTCADCAEPLATERRDDEVYTLRRCPECGQEWKELR